MAADFGTVVLRYIATMLIRGFFCLLLCAIAARGGTTAGVELHFPSAEDPQVTCTLTGLTGYRSADAQEAIRRGVFADYLKSLTSAKLAGKRSHGVGDGNIDANEAIALTVTQVNTADDESLFFHAAATQAYTEEDSSDLICYDFSDDRVVHSEFDRKGVEAKIIRFRQPLEKGDVILFAAGASGTPQWRISRVWAAIEKVGGGEWRVIPEDPRFPTDDVVVAYCSVADARYNLPANTVKQDCTAAIQAALDDASAAGGGTVFLPKGSYRIEGSLIIPSNVFLRGRWRRITQTQKFAGTLLIVINQSDQSTINLAGSGCGIRDLTFWRPSRKVAHAEASTSPFVITGRGGTVTIENVNLINLYNGIDLSAASACCLRGIYGSPLHVGLTADRSFAVSRYHAIRFSPDYWTWSGLPGSPARDGVHRAYMKEHGTAVNIKEMDGFYFGFSRISGYRKGIHFEKGASGDDASGEIAYVSVTDCYDALYVDNAKGFLIVGCRLEGSNYGIWGKDRSNYKLHTCAIKGGNKAISIQNGSAKLANCRISGETDISGKRTVYSERAYAEKLPRVHYAYDRVRKPAKTRLFNVKEYGASGNRSADDTKAFQAAIKAAGQNGGGIVFVPDGEYRVTENLNLGKGVELRGNSGGRHLVSDKPNQQLGSLVFVEVGEGDERGTAFITLDDGSGIRGIGFFYPHQDYKDFKTYPFLIRANGKRNYVIDCAAPNPYQGIELNGDDHLVEYSFFGGLRRTYQANGCSGGRIQNVHIKPDFWRTAWLPGCPSTAELLVFKSKVNHIYDVITLKDCENYTLMSIFNHSAGTFVSIDNSSGQGLMIGGEQQQRGYLFKNGAKTFDLLAAKCNINAIGDRTGTAGITLHPSFEGRARFFACDTMGTSDETWRVDGGHLFMQLCYITGPSNRAANSIACGPRGKITMQSSGATAHVIGFENKGDVSMKDCLFSYGLVHAAAEVYRRGNTFDRVCLLADLNQKIPKMYGLELDMTTIKMEEAIIVPDGGHAARSKDGRRLVTVRSTDGTYRLAVTEPAFQAGAKKDLTLSLEFYLDTDCTIETSYRTRSGMVVADTKTFSNAEKPKWLRYDVALDNAHFSSTEDIRLEIDGKPPLLAMVAILSPETPRI